MTIFTDTIHVTDPIGLHARPASQIVKVVKATGFQVKIGRASKSLILANSPLQLMAMKVKSGETLKITVQADDEAAATKLIEDIQGLLRG